jgi:hypothetical protein
MHSAAQVRTLWQSIPQWEAWSMGKSARRMHNLPDGVAQCVPLRSALAPPLLRWPFTPAWLAVQPRLLGQGASGLASPAPGAEQARCC